MLTALVAMLAVAPNSPPRTLTVFGAASLKESLTAIAREYEVAYPGVEVKLNFAGSQSLAAQINQGARADVFASAAVKNLKDIKYDEGTYRVFAKNKLQIAVRKGLVGVESVRDLAKARYLVVADPAVPVGHYTESFLTKASELYGSRWLRDVRAHVVSRELDVKSVLAKVKLGEADVGIVYVSDVATARGQVDGIAIPNSLNEIAEYPVAVPKGAKNKEEAKRFIDFMLDGAVQKIFERNGFVSVRSTEVSDQLSVISDQVFCHSLHAFGMADYPLPSSRCSLTLPHAAGEGFGRTSTRLLPYVPKKGCPSRSSPCSSLSGGTLFEEAIVALRWLPVTSHQFDEVRA